MAAPVLVTPADLQAALKKLEVAATHEGLACAHQADGDAADRRRLPGLSLDDRFAKERLGNRSVALPIKRAVKRLKGAIQPQPLSSCQARARRLAAGHCAMQRLNRADTEAEVMIKGEDDDQRPRRPCSASQQQLQAAIHPQMQAILATFQRANRS